jgi:hypothetical protein
MYRKNVASQYLYFEAVNASTGAAMTGLTIASFTKKRSIDGGAQADCTGTISEVGTGQYVLALSQADINGNNIGFSFGYSGMVPVSFCVLTTAADPTDAVHFGLSSLPNAAAEASGGLPTLSAAQASNGTIQANVHRWLTATPNALQSGRVDGYLGAVAAGVIAAASFAANALDAVWSTAARTLTAFSDSSGVTTLLGRIVGTLAAGTHNPQSGDAYARLGAPAGASVSADIAAVNAKTTNLPASPAAVGSNMGTVSSVTGSVNSVTTGVTLSAAAVQAIWDAATSALTTAGSIGKYLLDHIIGILATGTHNPQTGDAYARLGAAGAGLTALGDTRIANLDAAVSSRLATSGYTAPPTAGAVADQVWDEASADHNSPNTMGAKLNSAGAASDPWGVALPGAYTSGQAGKIVGDNLNAKVGDVKAKTDNMPASPAAVSDIPSAATIASTVWSAVTRTLTAASDSSGVTTLLGRILGTLDTGTHKPQTGDSYGRLGAPTGASVSADIAAKPSTADVNAQVVDALATDTYAEPGTVPAATSSLAAKIGWLFTLSRNKRTQTATTATLRNDGDGGNIGQATVSDDGTTFTHGKFS